MYVIYFCSIHPSCHLLILLLRHLNPFHSPNKFFITLSRLFYDPLTLIKVSHMSMDIVLFIEA